MAWNRILVHVSGGMDSAACAVMAVATGRPVHGLFVDIGQPYLAQERASARYVAHALGLVLHQHHVRLAALSLPGQAAHYVPHRNAVIAALSVHVAAVHGCTEVWAGSAREDTFNDNRPAFWRGMAAALARGQERGTRGVVFRTPVARWTRARVLREVRKAGLAPERLWWCYGAGDVACGSCKHCLAVSRAGL